MKYRRLIRQNVSLPPQTDIMELRDTVFRIMMKTRLLLIAGILAVAAAGCSSNGGQTANDSFTQNNNADGGAATDPEPFAFTDNYGTCTPENTYDEGEVTCYVDS